MEELCYDSDSTKCGDGRSSLKYENPYPAGPSGGFGGPWDTGSARDRSADGKFLKGALVLISGDGSFHMNYERSLPLGVRIICDCLFFVMNNTGARNW